MGLVNLRSLPTFIDINYQNYLAYCAEVGRIPGIRMFKFDESPNEGTSYCFNYQYIVLEIDESTTLLSRDEIVAILTCENVSARRYFFPGCHRMQPYKAFFPHAGLLLPTTNSLSSSVICLPTGTGITVDQIQQVGNLLRLIIRFAPEIKNRCAALPFTLPIAPGELPPV